MISEFHDHGWPFSFAPASRSPEKLRNVIEFVNCYETRNHLWVIFEYCAGGDLLRLLKQDSRLPEERAARMQELWGPFRDMEVHEGTLCWTEGGHLQYIQAVQVAWNHPGTKHPQAIKSY